MNSRDRMEKALNFEETDRIPHFEIMFELEKEAFGMKFPDRDSWSGMTRKEKNASIGLCMDIYEKIIDIYSWDALAVYWPWGDPEGVSTAVKRFGRDIYVGGICGKGIWSIEIIEDWNQFSLDLFDHRDRIHEQARKFCDAALKKIDAFAEAGADFVHLPNDIAFNAGPFIRPELMDEMIFPYWKEQVDRCQKHGMKAFIHSDGQVTPILERIEALGADCFQSIDPMAGVDIAYVKEKIGNRIALMGNVKCSLLQEGPFEAIRESAWYCLEHGSPGGGYIYSTSNTIFPGMPLENYQYMLDVYNEFNSSVYVHQHA